MANASSRCFASRLGFALLALEVIVVSDLVNGIYWGLCLLRVGGKFCLFFHNMGIGYQHLEKIGKKALYLVL